MFDKIEQLMIENDGHWTCVISRASMIDFNREGMCAKIDY